MRIQKSLVIIVVAAIGGAVFLQAKADDNDMQLRARALLRQNMATNLATNMPVNTVAPMNQMAPVAATPMAPVLTNAAPVEPPIAGASMPEVEKSAPTPAPGTTAEVTPSVEEQLRAAMRKIMAEQDAAKPKPMPAPSQAMPVQTTPANPIYATPARSDAVLTAAPTAPQVVPTAVSTTEIGDVAASQTNATPSISDQQLREKMRQRIAELDAQNKSEQKTAATAAAYHDTTPYGYTPPVAAPALVPGSKDAKLAQLLEQYKADQISPAEYHRKRAEILEAQ